MIQENKIVGQLRNFYIGQIKNNARVRIFRDLKKKKIDDQSIRTEN